MSPIRVVILAGGQGTRFWPISRTRKPKQFLSISPSGESLIQMTARRIQPLLNGSALFIVTNSLHQELTKEHVPKAEVLAEPIGRNTAASIGLAAIYARRSGQDPVLVILPADHAVKSEENLVKTLRSAVEIAANKDVLVTIGVKPTLAHTGYGYIKRGTQIDQGAYKVARFYEKPNLERAKKYIESDAFYWNSGMFAWRASVVLNAMEKYMPELYEGLLRIEASLDTNQVRSVCESVFENLESISIDFGVLEHATNCVVVESLPFGWNDVGSWDAWAEHFALDHDGNLLHGDALAIDAKDCVVHSENRLIAVLGAQDLIIIDGGDALLVCPRERVQDVRQIVEYLKSKGRDNLI